jgi:hypothetical protein
MMTLSCRRRRYSCFVWVAHFYGRRSMNTARTLLQMSTFESGLRLSWKRTSSNPTVRRRMGCVQRCGSAGFPRVVFTMSSPISMDIVLVQAARRVPLGF